MCVWYMYYTFKRVYGTNLYNTVPGKAFKM